MILFNVLDCDQQKKSFPLLNWVTSWLKYSAEGLGSHPVKISWLMVKNQGSVGKQVCDLLVVKGLTSEASPQPDPETYRVGVGW